MHLPYTTYRFSSDGRRLATCSDDRLAFVFELHPGPGKTVFGSSDKPSLENWKLLFPLRGHRLAVQIPTLPLHIRC